MQSKQNKFAVFILTHGRPDKVLTYKTLLKNKYTGPIYFIVDNLDKTVDKYIANFGKDNVIVFDKLKMLEQSDTANNTGETRTILMARNACFEIAKKLGFEYFLQLDDDYTSFRYRYIDKYVTKGESKNLDNAFGAMFDYYKSTNLLSLAFAQGGDFIGGASCGMLKNYQNVARKCMNTFFCSVNRPFKFVGAMNDDVNTYVTLGSRGNLFMTVPFIGVEQAATQQQKSGLTDMYLRFGTYCKSFTTTMMQPSSVKVAMMGYNNPRLHHRIDWYKTTPKIIREKHKKL